MKPKHLIAICIMSVLFLSAFAPGPKKTVEKPICADWMMPDSIVKATLGNRLSSVLFSPKSVKCYYLVGKEAITPDDVEIEKNYVREELLATLTPGEITVLQYALLKQSCNYSKRDDVIVMSPYMPILEFEFTKKKETVHVLVSLSDMTWTILYDGKKVFNYPYANTELISQFCNYYISLNKSLEK